MFGVPPPGWPDAPGSVLAVNVEVAAVDHCRERGPIRHTGQGAIRLLQSFLGSPRSQGPLEARSKPHAHFGVVTSDVSSCFVACGTVVRAYKSWKTTG